jgi:cation diffusion facilitator family transporter
MGAGVTKPRDAFELGERIAAASLVVNILLAAANIALGWRAHSTSVVAAGGEFLADVLAAGVVFLGIRMASRPADADHPYGHGRAEILSGMFVGVVLVLAGLGICSTSLRNYSQQHPPPAVFAIWPLAAAIVAKAMLAATKFRYGRRIRSAALIADGWNDAVDILSGGAALTALGLTLYDPARFLAADHFGGIAVGLIVISIGIRVARDTSLDLMDTMPPAAFLDRIRAAAGRVEGARGVEKCWARKTGFRYHVDLHLEVDPAISVAESHGIAEQVRHQIRRDVADVADVLVHVEPSPMSPSKEPVIQENGPKKRQDA